jgi:hypothetical protein
VFAKRCAVSVAVAACALAPTQVQAQIETAAVVLAGAEAVQNALNSVVSDLGAQAQGVVGFTSQQLTLQMNDLRRLARDQLEVPLTRLSLDAQSLARSIQGTTERLNDLLTKQRQCLASDAFVFLAAVRTLGEGIKNIPIIGSNKPRIAYYQFPNHSPAVVPLEGGRVTVSGYRLWSSTAPVLELLDESRKTKLGDVTPERGASEDEFTFLLAESIIKTHGQHCLQLHVQPRRATHFLFIPTGSEPVADLFAPICIPDPKPFRFRVDARHDYQCPRTEERTLEWKGGFYAEHTACEHDDAVSGTQTWAVPSNCRISSVEKRREAITREERNSTSSTYTRDSVTLNSVLGAGCTCLPIAGCHRNHHGVWSYSARPTILCDVADSKSANARTSDQTLTITGAPITACVNLSKDCTFATSDFEYTAYRVSDDPNATLAVIYQAPRISVGTAAPPSVVTVGKLALTATYNPGSAAPSSEACFTAKMESCNY